MKQKIKEALNKGYKNLGLNDEALERVATSVETLVTDETDLDAFVKNKAVEALMKFEQADADRKRTAQKKQGEGEKQEANTGKQSQNQQQTAEQPDLATAIASAVEAALEKKLNPLQEKLNAFEAAKAKEDAVSALDNFVSGWDYASGFPKERDLAKRVAMKVYKAGGEQMNGEQLIAAFREEFDPAVKEKGVTDFSQPFKGDGGGGEADADFSSFDRAAQELGWSKPDK